MYSNVCSNQKFQFGFRNILAGSWRLVMRWWTGVLWGLLFCITLVVCSLPIVLQEHGDWHDSVAGHEGYADYDEASKQTYVPNIFNGILQPVRRNGQPIMMVFATMRTHLWLLNLQPILVNDCVFRSLATRISWLPTKLMRTFRNPPAGCMITHVRFMTESNHSTCSFCGRNDWFSPLSDAARIQPGYPKQQPDAIELCDSDEAGNQESCSLTLSLCFRATMSVLIILNF